MKHCPKCNTETERCANGRCKPCNSAKSAAWKAANPAKVRATRAAYYASNSEKDNATSTAWRAANPDQARANNAAYSAKNRVKINARTAAWNAANPDRVRATHAAWYAANHEKVRAKKAAYYAANREKARTDNAAWVAANPEKVRAIKKAWAAANPENARTHHHNRRARKAAVGGNLSPSLAACLFKLQRGKCPCCGLPLGTDYHMDHKMPLALGGANEDWNIQLLRGVCNMQKNAKHPIDFMQSRGFLL